MTSSNKPKTASIFANKSDLEAAQRRIAELEAENRALKVGTTAQAPTASKPAPAQNGKGTLFLQYQALKKTNPTAAAAFWQKNKSAIFENK